MELWYSSSTATCNEAQHQQGSRAAPATCGAGPRAAQPPGTQLSLPDPTPGTWQQGLDPGQRDPFGTAIPWPTPALLPPGASVPTPGSPWSICACRALQHAMGSALTPRPLPPSGYPWLGFSPSNSALRPPSGWLRAFCCSTSSTSTACGAAGWDTAPPHPAPLLRRGLPKLDLASKDFPPRLLGSPAELVLGPGSPSALAEAGRGGLPCPSAQALTLQKAADEGCSLRQGLLQDRLPLLGLVAARRAQAGCVSALWRG